MCGIYGFVGCKKQPVDLVKFITLGVENDERGGHGCGIFVDGRLEYGNVTDKYFEAFYDKSNVLKECKEAEVMLGHDRKASVGGVSNEKLQPVTITNDNGDVDFVLLHNGTINNHTELAAKYLSMSKEDSDKLTDSQIMARIIYIHGFSVFAEYIGTGAFVMVDYRTPNRKPSVFVFKGASKTSTYAPQSSEERPLYYIREKDGIWLSSMPNALSIFCYVAGTTLYTFPTNVVLLVNHEDNVLKKVVAIDRTQCIQKETAVTHYCGSHSVNNNTQTFYQGQFYDQYDDPDDPSEAILYSMVNQNPTKGQLVYDPARRYCDAQFGTQLSGIYYIDDFGNYSIHKSQSLDKPLYLFNGIPVFGEVALRTMIDWWNQFTDCVDAQELEEYFPEVIYCLSDWPFFDSRNNRYLRYYGCGLNKLYDGKLYTPFHTDGDVCTVFKNGNMCDTTLDYNCFDKFYKNYKQRCKHNYSRIIHYLYKVF